MITKGKGPSGNGAMRVVKVHLPTDKNIFRVDPELVTPLNVACGEHTNDGGISGTRLGVGWAVQNSS